MPPGRNEEGAMTIEAEERFLTLPNILTLARFALAPIFALTVIGNHPFGALWVIFAAAATDVLDGFTARLLGLRTGIGTVIDPLADKVVGATAYVLLSIKSLGMANAIPIWLTATVLGRDFIILAGGVIISLARGRREFRPSVLGKITTVMQVTTIFWVVLANCVGASAWRQKPFLAAVSSPGVLTWLYGLTLAFTVISGAHYVVRGIRWMYSDPR
jgi:cardiolipin synthase